MTNPDIDIAPIAALIADWQRSGKYSEQTLHYLLTKRHGVRCWRPIQWANVAYLEWVLDGMEEVKAA